MLKRVLVFSLINLFFLLFLPLLALSPSLSRDRPKEPLLLVYHHQWDEVMELPLEEYLRGVVAGEMPASFPMEALKAQAVVARTYAFSKFYKPMDDGVHITTDSTIHQCWLSTKDLFLRWGPKDFIPNLYRIAAAVEATRGEVLIYQGQLIDALYHANAGGWTEDPIYLWEGTRPYLKSVPSPWDEQAPRFNQTFYFSLRELQEKLGLTLSSLQDVQVLNRSPSGRVQEIRVAGVGMKGSEFRFYLGLPSTLFTLLNEGSTLKIKTRGHGHGVGMSQYGAQGMAQAGYQYGEILSYYYQGVLLWKKDY